MIILLIIFIWLVVGLFGSISVLNVMSDDLLDSQDYIFASVMSVAGPINIFVCLILILMDVISGEKDYILVRPKSKPKLTLKQERVKKLKKLKKVSWFRFW